MEKLEQKKKYAQFPSLLQMLMLKKVLSQPMVCVFYLFIYLFLINP